MLRKGKVKFLLSITNILLVLSSSLFIPTVLALDLEVTGNGDSAMSEVNVTQSQETAVTQTNTSEIVNDVTVINNTGANSASDNSGDVLIDTGNSLSEVNINNSANSSQVETGCCGSEGSIGISGNGTDSNNLINTTLANATYLNGVNDASVANNVNGYSNTGGNTANSNMGNIMINSGDVYAKGEIVNGPINSFFGKVHTGSLGLSALISGNGDSSVNKILYFEDLTNFENVVNLADVLNNIYWYGNTGDNTASRNSGDVAISTGNVLIDFVIKNGPINSSYIEIDCCEADDPEDPEDPEDPTDPEDPGDPVDPADPGDDKPGTGGSGGGGTDDPQVASYVSEKILGLSNTSGSPVQALIFWLGAIIFTLGVNFFGKTIFAKKLAHRG